jgi:hypothetical protein
LAASQKTGAVEGKFETAGVVAVANATFTLTTGVDTGATFTGGAGNDTLNATVATMGALDVVTGGDGTDTISINESVDVTALTGSYTGFETLNLTTTGSIGSTNTTAGTASTTATAQAVKFTLAAATASQNYTVTIGGVAYTTQNAAATTADGAWGAIKKLLQDKLGNAVAFDDVNYKITSNNAGQPLPSIAIAINSSGTGTASIAAAATNGTTANATPTGTIAMKQVVSITTAETTGGTAGTTTADDLAAGDVLTLNIGGVDYPFASSGATATTLGTDIAAVINAVLGTGVAVATAGTVIVTATTAGTALPTITLDTGANKASAVAGDANDWSATVSQIVANQGAVAVAASAGAVSAPTGITTYNATASGVANVTGAATAKMVVSGTTVQTSGGLDVSVTGTKSVGVSAAKGAVVVTTSNASTGEVINNNGTGATTATYASGIYVTGGTTVGITQTGATVSSASVVSAVRANPIQVGVNPTDVTLNIGTGVFAGAVKSPSSSTTFNAVGGLSSAPTGDVTITTEKTYTTAAGKTSIAYGTGSTKAFTNGATTVSMTGVGTGTVTDVNTTFVQSSITDAVGAVAGASKLATVNLTGISGTTTIKSDAISTVNVLNSTSPGAVVVSNSGTADANIGTFNLSVGNSTVSVTNATTKAVNVSSTATTYQTINGTAPATNSNALTLVAGDATSLNFTNANTITLTNGGLAKVGSITKSGAGNLTLGDVSSGWTKLTSIDASTATGKVSVTLGSTPSATLTNGFALKTGSGADTVTLSGDNTGTVSVTAGGLATTTIDLGAGNDSLLKVSGTAGAVISGASIEAGEGTDTVSVALVNAGNAAIFKNFERVAVKFGADAGTFDAALMANSTITGVVLNGNLAATVTNTFGVSNISGTTANFDVTGSTSAIVTGTLATATGTADSAVVNFSSSNTSGTDVTVTAGGVKTTALESLTVASGGSITNTTDFATVALNNVLSSFEDTGNTVASVTVTGANELTLGAISVTRDASSKAITAVTFTTDFITQSALVATAATPTANVQSKLTTIDGSAATGSLNIYAGVANDIFYGTTASSTNSTYDLVFDGLAIKGGTASDAIRNDAKLGTIEGGAGGDWLYVGGLTGSANGGDGDDTLNAAGVSNSLTGGAGKDTFNVSVAVAGGAGSVAATANTAPYATTIADFAKGDSIKLASTVSGLYDATTSIASATTLTTAIAAALGNANVTQGNAGWFVYGNNTYIVLEDADAGLTNGDVVVKLTGIFDLSTQASLASNVITGL